MARWLKQSTSVDVPIGPFLDSTDGITAETGLTITQPDIRLKKNGGAWAQKNAAQTLSHEENGFYEVTLDATDTNTLGLLRLAVFETGAMPVWEDFEVVTANVWDSYFGADLLQVDTRELGGTTQTARDIGASVLLSSGTGTGQVTLASGVVSANAVQVSGDATAADNLETAFDDTAGAVPWQGIIDQGTAQSATSTTLVLRAAATFADDQIIGSTIVITGGSAGVGQSRTITDYVSATDTATVAAWTTTPTGTITYKIFATAPSTGGIDAAGVRSAIGLASPNLDTQLAAVQADTDDIQARLPAALVSGRIDASVGAMAANVMTAAAAAADLTTELQTGLATAANLSTLQTSVNDVPTNAELATALGTADDAVLAQVALVKAKTDQLTFGATNTVNANITHVIADPVQENGATGTNWGGVP